ncbi:MAG: hypothetical protein ACKVKF_05840, partial [Rhodobacterales bacterium]
LATRAARARGFEKPQAETFGRAAVRHVAEGRNCEALLSALRDPDDSPILRLPLMLRDLLAACAVLDGTVEMTLNQKDADLAKSYAQLLPVHLDEFEVVHRADLRRLRIVADTTRPASAEMPQVSAPDALIESLRRMATRSM